MDVPNDQTVAAPRPPGRWLFGNAPDFMADKLGYVERIWRAHGDVVRCTALKVFNWYVISHRVELVDAGAVVPDTTFTLRPQALPVRLFRR